MPTILEHESESVSAYSRGDEHQPSRQFLALFACLMALYCLWVFSLRVFPTQDDAIHVYYVNVIKSLLRGDENFRSFYFLRHPPPPYILHYAILFGLTSFLQPVLAEKCVVCLILVITGFGFRFLATAIGRNAGLMSLWIVPAAFKLAPIHGLSQLLSGFGIVAMGLGLLAPGKKRRRTGISM